MAERRKFESLQAGRGIAALMVVLFHIGGFVGREPGLWQRPGIYNLFYVGLYGVDFFFIMSGVVILSAHARDLGHADRVGSFLMKRFRRIYPIYWVFLIPTLIKQFMTDDGHAGMQRNGYVIVSGFLLVHIKSLAVNMVPSWTLFHEVLFYSIFTTFLLNKRIGLLIFSLWLAASCFFFTPSAYSVQPDKYLEMLFSPLHLLFGFGLVVGWILKNRRGPTQLWVLVVSIIFVVATLELQLSSHTESPWLRTLTDVGLALFLLSMAEREASLGMHVPRFLCFMGEASYVIYLSHFMVISVVARKAFQMDKVLHLPIAVWIGTMFLMATCFGVAAHVWIERPLLQWMARRTAAPVPVTVV